MPGRLIGVLLDIDRDEMNYEDVLHICYRHEGDDGYYEVEPEISLPRGEAFLRRVYEQCKDVSDAQISDEQASEGYRSLPL
jgi:hypothetical protein